MISADVKANKNKKKSKIWWLYLTNQRQILCNSSSALSWTWGPLLNFLAKWVNFKDSQLSVLGLWPFYVVTICFTYIWCAWLLTLTLYIFNSIHFNLFLLQYLWTTLKSILCQSRCSLEPKIFLRVLCPLNPLLGSQNTPRPPSSVGARYAHFSTDYIHSWYHGWYLHMEQKIGENQKQVFFLKKKSCLKNEWRKYKNKDIS